MTDKIGIIDLGSNSARLIVMNIYVNGAYNLVYHQKESVRLSEGMGGKNTLSIEAMDRAIDTLKLFAHMCQLIQVTKILGVATAAVRNAKNGSDFLVAIFEQTGIALKPISGNTEAWLGYAGMINTLDVNDAVLFDLGGGSFETTLIKKRKVQKSVSIPFGAVNLTEKFGTQDKITAESLHELYSFVMKQLAKHPWLAGHYLPLVGIGGTARNLAKMVQKRNNYPFNKVHNYRLGVLALTDLWNLMASSDMKQRSKFPGISSERADIIVAGITVVKCLFDFTKADRMIISGCGVREGLFFQHYLQQTHQPEVIPDTLLHSTQNMLLFYKGDTAHATHVANLAEAMFDGWQELHNLTPRDKSLLRVACLLHDIGITINYYDHARHSAYLVENARLFGLTHREQMLAAVVTGWHHGATAKYMRNSLYNQFLDDHDWLSARKMALLLALAECLDSTQMGLIKKVQASTRLAGADLTLYTQDKEGSIEMLAINKHRKWFKREFGLTLILNNHPQDTGS